MSGDNLSEQSSLVQAAISNLRHSDDAQVGREISRLVEESKKTQRAKADQQQETLQALSRRLQAARTRVEASKAQREQKSHAETMRDLECERLTTDDAIAEQEQLQLGLQREIEELEARVAELDRTDVEKEQVPDESVLKLQILRGLGVEPLADPDTGAITKARLWTAADACVVAVDENMPAQQMATRLWDLCSSSSSL
ncbi:hypothetical protein GGI21_006504 [Coemansia aciculifera]|uniref:Uncharacterized protein n=1 Tax=Coemansia aciculifera TaxID=417176 RepID=A0ACC1M9A7_9FUNG|nr:hypothetical protein GGI21_006504 [Coemansia aciculifera]KAJ2900140.1 hypothetical protein IWW38_000680 [Coemansia aciculifera]